LSSSDPDERLRRVAIDLWPHLPEEARSGAWGGLIGAQAVHVFHTRMAAGFIFRCAPPRRRILVFSGDTMPADTLIERGRGADLLIHECSFEDGLEDQARFKRHSTMGQAVDVGRRMGAKNVVLTHFSSRYPRVPPLPDYLLEAGNVSVAFDNMVVNFDTLPLLPRMLHVFRELYKKELLEIHHRDLKRDLNRRLDGEDYASKRVKQKRRN